MEAAHLRLRVVFEGGGILSKSQKQEGLKHSWVFLKPQLRTISDLIAYLLHIFDLHYSCPNGIILSMDGFVLPPFESIAIFKDTDLIRVKKKGTKFGDVTKEIKGLETLIQDEIIEKQPLPSDIKLLANEEYNKETGGYESETDDAAGENVVALENSSHGDIISKKRKASNRVGSSKTKTKRQRHIASESVQKKPVNQCEQVRTPEKKGQHENETHPEVGIKGTKNIELMSGSKETKTKRRGHRSPETVQKKPDRCEIVETPEKKRRHENEIKTKRLVH